MASFRRFRIIKINANRNHKLNTQNYLSKSKSSWPGAQRFIFCETRDSAIKNKQQYSTNICSYLVVDALLDEAENNCLNLIKERKRKGEIKLKDTFTF